MLHLPTRRREFPKVTGSLKVRRTGQFQRGISLFTCRRDKDREQRCADVPASIAVHHPLVRFRVARKCGHVWL